MIRIEAITFNEFQVNTYLVWDDTGECLVVDPSFYSMEEKDRFRSIISELDLKIIGQINTHCHVDHILGVDFMKSEYNCPVRAHREELKILTNAPLMGDLFGWTVEPIEGIDKYLVEGEEIPFGHHFLRIAHVPGHSPGSVAFISREGGFIITGDALFKGSIGRTDLPGGDYDTLMRSIGEKILKLPHETLVYPGHGPSSTVGYERENNPYLKEIL